MLEFWNSYSAKAAKDHQCSMCLGTIKKGEPYKRYSGKNDGEFLDYKYHAICWKLWDRFADIEEESEMDRDEIFDWLSDEVCCDCLVKDMDECDYCGGEMVNCDRIKAKIMDDEYWEKKKLERQNRKKRFGRW